MDMRPKATHIATLRLLAVAEGPLKTSMLPEHGLHGATVNALARRDWATRLDPSPEFKKGGVVITPKGRAILEAWDQKAAVPVVENATI